MTVGNIDLLVEYYTDHDGVILYTFDIVHKPVLAPDKVSEKNLSPVFQSTMHSFMPVPVMFFSSGWMRGGISDRDYYALAR